VDRTSGARLVAPGRLQIRDGGGCMAWFGSPFFLAGIFLVLAGLGIIPMSGPMPGSARILLPLMGVAFTAVGGALVFGRSWTTVDTSRGIVVKEWGLLVPMRTRTHVLESYAAVRLGFERGDSDSSDHFPISLKSRAGPSLLLDNPTQYAEARRRAAAIAGHLQIELEDATTDHPVRLTADAVDLPFTARAAGARDAEPHVTPPPGDRVVVMTGAQGVTIEISRPRAHPLALTLLLLPIAVPIFAYGPLRAFFAQTRTPGVVGWTFLGFLTLTFGVLPAVGAFNAWRRSHRGRTIVTSSAEGIRVAERGAWWTTTTASIPARDILDIDYSSRESAFVVARQAAEQKVTEMGHSASEHSAAEARALRWMSRLSRFVEGRGVTVKTRDVMTTFGEGLSDDEVRYVYLAVRRGLLG
jgi:hypothetical protein